MPLCRDGTTKSGVDMLEFRDNATIRKEPLEDPVRLNLVIDKRLAQKLKLKAVELDTTVNEILRVLVQKFLDSESQSTTNREQ